jgi:signal transduction histidine kinase
VSTTLALTGWLVALAGFATAVVAHLRLARHLEAVARACHELRGPLAAVRLGLEFAVRFRQLPRHRFRAIALEDLAAARAARRGCGVDGRGVDAERVDLGELVADSVEAWRAYAATRGVCLQLVRPDHALLVTGERLRLAQAVGNLLANAIEHGGGEVVVSLRAESLVVRFEIVDEGPGLPAPIDRLCERRAGRRRSGEHGHGLGVVSAVAAAQGGRLASAPSDRGARLVLEFPRAGLHADELSAS